MRNLLPLLGLVAFTGIAITHEVVTGTGRPAVAQELSEESKPNLIAEFIVTLARPQFHEAIEPLGDLIAKGEGDWNAVNRGWAGDTPGGLQYVIGTDCNNVTVGEIISLQNQGRIYAVGRYQFIPTTLRYAVNVSDVTYSDYFTPQVQNELFAALLEHKRPAVAAYLRGDHDNLAHALDEMAREWSSVEYRNGRGYHDHVGGNRAHITRWEMSQVLDEVRSTLV